MRYFSLVLLLFSTYYTLYAQSSYQEVVARDGDGIYTLLRQHGLDPSQHLKAFLELNKENIGKDNRLYKGKVYRLPEAVPDEKEEGKEEVIPETVAGPSKEELNKKSKKGSAEVTVPLFGKKYEKVEIKEQLLNGAVYYLLAGHGGPDPGAMGKYGPYWLSEDEYAYDVTIRLGRRLIENGATVYMIIQDKNDGIRDDNILLNSKDEVCYPDETIPYSQKERLRQRTRAVNALYLKHIGAYQRMVAIHVDSRNKGENIDVFFYHHENSPDGKRLADNMHQVIKAKYNRYQPNREYLGSVTTRSSLYVVKYSSPPTVFIELGNIKNKQDQRRFVLPDNRQALANWLFEGILADYKLR